MSVEARTALRSSALLVAATLVVIATDGGRLVAGWIAGSPETGTAAVAAEPAVARVGACVAVAIGPGERAVRVVLPAMGDRPEPAVRLVCGDRAHELVGEDMPAAVAVLEKADFAGL